MTWLADLWAQVYPNLVASAVWAAPGALWARWHFRRLHRGQQSAHDKLDALNTPTGDDVAEKGGA